MGMTHGTDGMHSPTWKNEWSWNSIAIIIGIGVTIAGWGYVVGQVNGDIEALTKSNSELQAEVRRIENETRRFEALEFRVAANERRSEGAANSMRTVEQTVIGLSSDMRLVMEILGRMERGQNGGQSPFRGAAP